MESIRTSTQIKAEIEEKLGFLPPFFEPALQNTQVFENLWQQTLSAYINNPFSDLFKAKLSAYLSRYCAVPYCMICHSCSLHSLGIKAKEVLQLLEAPPLKETEVYKHFSLLANRAADLKTLPETDSILTDSLLYCAIYIFLAGEEAQYYRQEMSRLLGTVNYQHLVTFLAYIKTCHVWMEAHPEILYQADRRVIDNFQALVVEEPDLSVFFQKYRQKVRNEQQNWEEKLKAIVQRQQIERLQIGERRVLEMIATGASLADVLNTLTNTIEEQSSGLLCSILLLDEDGKNLRQGVAPSLPKSYFWGFDYISVAPNSGSCGTAAYFGKPVIVTDISTDPLWAEFKDFALKHGLQACWSMPILATTGKVLGTFAMYYCQPRSPSPHDLQVIELAAHLAGIAIERKQVEEKLRHDALHDALTSLPNRVLFVERLSYLIRRAKQDENCLFAVLLVDLDRFKIINDSLGHLIGDQLLIALARKLELCVRSNDTVARLGGDEFAIIVENLQESNDAIHIAERIHQQLAIPFNLNNQEVFTSASIGIAFSSTGYEHLEDLLRDADTAMYRAKELGKARHEVFQQGMHIRGASLLHLENDLRKAVERQELKLYYQPIICLKNGKIKGFEALLRWQHPERGAIFPEEFIPIAEDSGLIISIGEWVLNEACQQMQSWHKLFPTIPPLSISVNLSGKQIAHPELFQQIERISQATNFNFHNLKLEVTERMLMDNNELAANLMLKLQALGVQLYMDDFGKGYSSLNYLHQFPITSLKIDRSFINQISVKGQNLEIIQAMVSLAHNLGIEVIAKGVETAEQFYKLKALNCQYAQGYFFAEPLTSMDAKALIARDLQWCEKDLLLDMA